MPSINSDTRYGQVAHAIERDIERQLYRPGERLPGVRRLAQQYRVSISTALEACRLLEDRGRLEAKLRSGFFVRTQRHPHARAPAISDPPNAPNAVTGQQLAMQLIKAANNPQLLPLGAAVPHAQFMPVQTMAAAMTRVLRKHDIAVGAYAFPPGHVDLRRQIAKRMTEQGCPVDPDAIVITNGCQEALGLALRALTQAGDVVAIESPTFYGLLQVIEALGLKALEIPTHPHDGISIEALEFALQQWPVRACIVSPNFSNPLGSAMSTARKRDLVELLGKKNIPLIEDDVYGDLGFDGTRPGIAKAFDNDNVVYCSSFSKTLTPGLRVGWIAAGRHQAQIEYHKYVLNLAAPTAPQMAVADLLERGGYDRYLRQARRDYATAVARMIHAVEKYFPDGTRVTQPQGGFVIWVEFPAGIDGNVLYGQALAHGISIAPGTMFSATGRYGNFIRLNCAVPWDARTEKAIARLGQLALAMAV